MKTSGSVTVAFSLVFLIMFSFILSFFEMASYTARLSYHAAAARLATENYFASYLEPMYSKYHIFGRDVPQEEDVLVWTEESISEDVDYMTKKKEGEKSLLIRGGADYKVTEASVLTDRELEGYYTQAVTAMKYQGVVEVADLIKEFAGMTEQSEAHLDVAAAKAAADSAYGRVDEKLLYLMALVDGVDIKKYEKFLGGKTGSFQKGIYVKYFCTHPDTAAAYFDRTEVYQAFLKNHENPYETLGDLCTRLETLINEILAREKQETICRSQLAEARGRLSVLSGQKDTLSGALELIEAELREVKSELMKQKLMSGKEETVKRLEQRIQELDAEVAALKEQKEQVGQNGEVLEKFAKELEAAEKQLKKQEKEQEKAVKALKKEETEFVKKCRALSDVCGEAYEYTAEIQKELKAAQRAKATCESLVDASELILGSDVCGEYREDLKEYLFYESEEGYDFELIRQTLSENRTRLFSVKERIGEAFGNTLSYALADLKQEREMIKEYSFRGLKLDYGEMSLEEDLYSDVGDSVSGALAEGFLGFLTDKNISEKKLDTSYLPSGFRFKDAKFDFLSIPGGDMSSALAALKGYLPKELSFDGVLSQVAEQTLFHSYLVSHFDHFIEENSIGALSYEQEYLITGEDSDKENLSSVAARICGIRTVLHFISIYTDGAKKAPIEQAALAACGIIGLPALKCLIVLLLVFVWALEEAMVDTAALLLGKKLSLYPGRSGGSISLPEILLFSKSFVLEKARSKAETGMIGYQAYLQVFLIAKTLETKKYRSLDLIQENIRNWYASSFRVNRCVWEIEYQTDKRKYEYRYE